MTSNPSKKIALITGGAGGIGKAICRKFEQNNIEVALTDVALPEKESSSFFECDIRKSFEIVALYDWVMAHFGVPDILVLNAGIGIREKLYEGDPEKW